MANDKFTVVGGMNRHRVIVCGRDRTIGVTINGGIEDSASFFRGVWFNIGPTPRYSQP